MNGRTPWTCRGRQQGQRTHRTTASQQQKRPRQRTHSCCPVEQSNNMPVTRPHVASHGEGTPAYDVANRANRVCCASAVETSHPGFMYMFNPILERAIFRITIDA